MVALILLVGACSQGNDPASWSEAYEDGNLRDNYMKACIEANQGGEIEFTESQRSKYCVCAFGRVVEYFGGSVDANDQLVDSPSDSFGRDFEGFRELENSLRDDPEALPADLESLFRTCRDQARGL